MTDPDRWPGEVPGPVPGPPDEERRPASDPGSDAAADPGPDVAADADASVDLIRFWYRRHAGRVYRYARWRTGARDSAEAVVSDVFLEAWRSSGDYDPEQGSVESWLLGIARNVMRREQRRRAREAEPFAPSDLEELPSHRPTPEEEILRDDRRRRLLEAVWELPRDDRDLVALIYGAELSSQRAARLLETTPGAVRTRLHRILRRLRDELDDA